jgi:hypothetical protein
MTFYGVWVCFVVILDVFVGVFGHSVVIWTRKLETGEKKAKREACSGQKSGLTSDFGVFDTKIGPKSIFFQMTQNGFLYGF